MKAYEWPKKFVSIMKEAATKATSGTRALLHFHPFPVSDHPLSIPTHSSKPQTCCCIVTFATSSLQPGIRSVYCSCLLCEHLSVLLLHLILVHAAAEQREFETSLKKRKRDFGETLERYEAEVDKYAQRSELSKRDEVAAQVADLSQKLKEVSCLTPSCSLHQLSMLLLSTRHRDCILSAFSQSATTSISIINLYWNVPSNGLCSGQLVLMTSTCCKHQQSWVMQ